MRAVTFALLALVSVSGCYLSYAGSFDGGPVPDGRRPDVPVRDGGVDAREDLPACTRPMLEWAFFDETYPGTWSRSLVGMRDGERTWLAAFSPETGQSHILDMSFDGPTPRLARNLPAGAGVVVGAAMDAARIALALQDVPRRLTEVRVLDPDARFLANAVSMAVGTRVSLSLRSTRIALAQAGGVDLFAAVELRDVSNAEVIGGSSFEDYEDVSVGHGLRLFHVIATPAEGESELFGLDDLGATRAGPIGARMREVRWDGLYALGIDASGMLAFRAPRSAVRTIVPPRRLEPGRDQISLAMLRSDPWIAIGNGAWVDLGDGTAWHEVTIPGEQVVAHADATHRGAFVLVGAELHWVGWSCAR